MTSILSQVKVAIGEHNTCDGVTNEGGESLILLDWELASANSIKFTIFPIKFTIDITKFTIFFTVIFRQLDFRQEGDQPPQLWQPRQ